MKANPGLAVVLSMVFLGGVGCESVGPRTVTGAVLGAAAGAIAGAQIDDHNPKRGALIGGVGGALIGGVIGRKFDEAARRAAKENRKVVTSGQAPGERVVATPIRQEGDCRIVEVKYLDRNGKILRTEIRRVPIG